MNARINWRLLADTVKHFEKAGYEYVEVPWLVSDEAIKSTYEGVPLHSARGLKAVGSGEQSFIELLLQKKLAPGKYVTLTPCFRDEQEITELNQHSFMKVELIDCTPTVDQCEAMMNLCQVHFYQASARKTIVRVKTEDGFDLNLADIEIGSYGIRSFKELKWAYGTAMAEPRFSIALEKASERLTQQDTK